jgi:hypothetical protein
LGICTEEIIKILGVRRGTALPRAITLTSSPPQFDLNSTNKLHQKMMEFVIFFFLMESLLRIYES